MAFSPSPQARNHVGLFRYAHNLAVTLLPAVVFAQGNQQPDNELYYGVFSSLAPISDKIHNLVTEVVWDPDPGQISPRFFLP